jgi:hypothetical protein
MGTEMVAETLMGFKELTPMKAREGINSVLICEYFIKIYI